MSVNETWYDNILNYIREIASNVPIAMVYLRLLTEYKAILNSILTRIRSLPDTLADIQYLTEEFKSTRVYVKTTATPLPGRSLRGRKTLTVYNESDAIIYLGGKGLSCGTGIPLLPGDPYSADANDKAILYGRVPRGTDSKETRVLEGK